MGLRGVLHGAPDAHHTELSLERVVLFSDAVMAIAITLLAVDIRVPDIPASLAAGELPGQLALMQPKFTSFVISFVVVGVYWLAHNRIMSYVRRANGPLMLLNLLFLLGIAAVPFVANLLGSYAYLPLPNVVYAFTAAAIGLSIAALWWYASHDHRLIDPTLAPEVIRATRVRMATVPALFLLSAPLAYIRPWLTQVAWFLSPLLAMLVSRWLARA